MNLTNLFDLEQVRGINLPRPLAVFSQPVCYQELPSSMTSAKLFILLRQTILSTLTRRLSGLRGLMLYCSLLRLLSKESRRGSSNFSLMTFIFYEMMWNGTVILVRESLKEIM